MEEEKYLVREAAEALGVNAGTLRNYEKEGLLSVNSAKRTGDYSPTDLRMALQARLYRSMGFSVEEAKELLNGADVGAILGAFTLRRKEVEKERQELERLERAIGDWEESVAEASTKTGRCWFEKGMKSCYAVLKNGPQYQFSGGKDTDKLLARLQGQIPCTRQVFYVPEEVLRNQELGYEEYYGMAAGEDWVRDMGLERQLADYRLSYEGTMAVTILRSETGWMSRAELMPLLAYIERKGFESAGSMIGTVLAGEFGERGSVAYFKLYLPVRPK